MTREGIAGPIPDVRVGLCIRCRTLTTAPVAVRWIESDGGPGTILYACPKHAAQLGAGPTPDDVIRTR
ncbi:hypothetical protein ACFVFQ_37030 [Streptomyces sp. NPDC057743]|uniref:hypothetical protein n=1 Tax=Streptomyces sp. NPDC057743 TaxID=3346236 RepID=UPI0036AFC796